MESVYVEKMKKSLVYITPRTPWPLITGDRIRCFNLLKRLSVNHNVTLIILDKTGDTGELERYTQQIITLKKKSKMKKIIDILWSVLRGRSLQEGIFHRGELSMLLHERKFDVAIFHLLRASANKSYVNADRFILDMCDPVSLTYKQTFKKASIFSIWFFISYIETILTGMSEKKSMSAFNKVYLHTMSDAKQAGLECEKLCVSTMGIPVDHLEQSFDRSRMMKKLLFIGNLDYFPNKSGLEWFIVNVFDKLPHDYTLTVVGAGGKSLKSLFKNRNRVIFTGLAPDLKPYLGSHGVGVAPMFIASGIQNKALEYLYCGLSVFCSEKVKNGLSENYRDGVISNEMSDEIDAAHWITSLTHHKYDMEQAKINSNKVATCHDWTTIAKHFEANFYD